MAQGVSFSNYGFHAATFVWALGWIATATLAIERVNRSSDLASVIAFLIATIFATAGSFVIIRLVLRRNGCDKAVEPETPTKMESWSRRAEGWFAGLVWCAVAVVWNFGIIGWQLRSAHEGRGWHMLFVIPHSLIGWLLMNVLFVQLGIVIDSLIGASRRE